MNRYRKVIVLIVALMMILLCGCATDNSGKQTENTKPEVSETEDNTKNTEDVSAPADNAEAETGKTLVVYFSASGTTKGVAEKIASITGGDLYEILAAQPYTSADLNWHDSQSRTTHEQNDSSARPEISSETVDLSAYSVIYVGYPIWWGEEPRIMDTFVEKYDFSGKTVIPFCTSSSSGIGRSGQNLADNAKSGNWLSGRRFAGSVSESELKNWIDGLK